jgi:hypothetical protein
MIENLFAGMIYSDEYLRRIINISEYLECLKKGLENLYVCIAVKDTPCRNDGSNSEEIYKKLNALGLKQNISKTFRASYAAIIDGGKVKEAFDAKGREVGIADKTQYGEFAVKSAGYSSKNLAHITFAGKEYVAENLICGISFLVVDKSNGSVIDAVAFDVWNHFKCLTRNKEIVMGTIKGAQNLPPQAPSKEVEKKGSNENYI